LTSRGGKFTGKVGWAYIIYVDDIPQILFEMIQTLTRINIIGVTPETTTV
jgi:hypothetical protein